MRASFTNAGRKNNPRFETESGNVVFLILLAIVLIGIVTAALRSSGIEGANTDRENLAIQVSQVKQYASQIERAVGFILQNDASEVDIRFAHPDAPSEYGTITTTPQFQVFSRTGGAAEYKRPSSGINDGSRWEFYGGTALPQVGSPAADLVAVLPNVTVSFCQAANRADGFTGQPADTATCVNAGTAGRFSDITQFSGIPNTLNEASFSTLPAPEGCVVCDDGKYHFFHVLMAR